MATYKVLQDIEAEDKLIGPLTLRQFIYALIAALFGYLTFLVVSKGAPALAAVFLPLTLIPAFFAWPWGRDQPTEVWALAKIRFMVMPRKRIWNQSGIKELVTITIPKKVERMLTNGLTQNEVESRLRTLANTIDTRGWAIKNVNVNMYGQTAMFTDDSKSDRLIGMSSLPQPVSNIEVKASDDMLDVQNNPVAQQFDSLINASAKAHHQQIINSLQSPVLAPIAPPSKPTQAQPVQPANNYWFLSEPDQGASTVPQDAVTFNTQVVTPGSNTFDPVAAANPTPYEEEFIKHLKNDSSFGPNRYGHMHVVQPLSAQQATIKTTPMPSTEPTPPRVTRQPDAAILDLATNNDLNVATIAREAQKRKDPPPNEVVISLH